VAEGVDTDLMNTALDTRRPLLRRHTEIIGGVLVAVLLAVAHWYSGPLLYVFFDEYAGFTGVEPRAGLIPYLLAMAVLVFVALTSAGAVARCVSWILFTAAWISAFFTFWGYEWDGHYTTPLETIVATLMWFWVAAPPVAFLLVCRRLPRPRFDTYLAEALLLLPMVIVLISYTSSYGGIVVDPAEEPLDGFLVHLGMAAYFGVAAWLVPTRRIVYGAAALAGALIAATGGVLTATEAGYGMDSAGIQLLFVAMAVGLPVAGLVLQTVKQRRGRAGEPVSA
jgi:hypothetical protein